MFLKHVKYFGKRRYDIGNRGVERIKLSYVKGFWKKRGYNVRVIKQKPNEYNIWVATKRGKK